MPYVYSTASADIAFHQFGKAVNAGVPRPILHTTVIKGGANIHTRLALQTPLGVATEISHEELDILLNDPTFNKMVENGFLKVDKANAQMAVEKAVSDMEAKDKSAPTTPEDFSSPDSPKPFVNGQEKKVLI